FISYDDPTSLKIKVDYAASKGLAGTMIWSENMDYNNELIDVVHTWQNGGGPSGGGNTTSSTSSPSSTSTTNSTPSPSSSSSPSYTATTSTSATSSAPGTTEPSSTSQTTSTGGSGPVPGASCTSEDAYQCAKADGTSASYLLCLFGTWTTASCGAGTVCYQSGTSITCDWPPS
ncbi:hypothetical protein EV175_005683, partial [Coemansia sp. RSA 1933]